MDLSLLTVQIAVLGLLSIACLSAIALNRINFPYTIGLVVVGLVIGFVGSSLPGMEAFTGFQLSYNAILFLFLPPLIFESALTLDARLLLRNVTPVLALVTVGILLVTAIVSLLMVWLTPLNWRESLLFGALISATDPVAVIALFKNLGVPKQLVVLVEGESLLNDATGIVIFNLVLAGSATGTKNIAISGIDSFLGEFLGGILVGSLLAWLMSYLLIATYRNFLIQGTLSAILAFGTFILAQHVLQVSGVIAVVSAGLVTSWTTSVRLNLKSREFLYSLWSYLAFLTDSLVFLLVGLASARALQQIDDLSTWGLALVVAIAAILVSRAVAIFTLLPLINHTRTAPAVSFAEQTVLFWGGLRGAVGLALALSLENQVANGQFMVALTLGVVVFTLLVPGTTMGKLLSRLGFNQLSLVDRIGVAAALISAYKATLHTLENLHIEGDQHPAETDKSKEQTKQKLIGAEQKLEDILADTTDLKELQYALWLQALTIEQESYRQMHDNGVLSDPAFVRVNRSLSNRQSDLFADRIPPNQLRFRAVVAQVKTAVTRSFTNVISGSSWHSRLKIRRFQILYECDLAIHRASDRVTEQLQNLHQYDHTDKTIFSNCIKHYTTEHKEAFKRIVQSNQQTPEATRIAGKQIVHRVAARSRRQAIANLLEDGVISTTVDKTVRQQLRNKIY